MCTGPLAYGSAQVTSVRLNFLLFSIGYIFIFIPYSYPTQFFVDAGAGAIVIPDFRKDFRLGLSILL